VKDLALAKGFYIDVLGLTQHDRIASWVVINEFSAIHLVETQEPALPDQSSGTVRHFALQVADLSLVAARLLDAKVQVFQMDRFLHRKEVESTLDDLSFGTGTLFAEDPSRNLVEFIEISKGLFAVYR
jgi:extradiol dioxygenase family protein